MYLALGGLLSIALTNATILFVTVRHLVLVWFGCMEIVVLTTLTILVSMAPSGRVTANQLLIMMLVWDGLLLVVLLLRSTLGDREGRQFAASQLPILGSVLPLIWFKEVLLKVAEKQRNLRDCLQIVEDIPDIILSMTDMYFFGGSWFALFELSMSIIATIIFLVRRYCNLPNLRSDDTSHRQSQTVGAVV